MIGSRFVKFVGKPKFPAFLITKLLPWAKLMLEWYRELAVLSNDLLDIIGEAIVRINLLFD